MMPVNTTQLLSPRDLADWLGIPVSTVYQWRHHNAGPAGFRVGRHVRYRAEDVESWLQDHADDQTSS